MKIGVFTGNIGDGTIEGYLDAARQIAADGFHTYWLPQLAGTDVMTVIAIAAREIPDLHFGTAVVPTFPRHPAVMAMQALTVQAAAQGRFHLGIGLSHQVVIENSYAMDFARPIRHLREYLAVLMPLVHGEPAAVKGETLGANVTLSVPGAANVPVIVAALGEQTLKLAGRVADGTITWMCAPEVVVGHTIPIIDAAAERAGRARPRTICALPICVTSDVDTVRTGAGKAFARYGQMPSYRAMLDKAGLAGPGDVALVGNEDEVGTRLEMLREAGIDEFVASLFARTPDDKERTRKLLQSFAG